MTFKFLQPRSYKRPFIQTWASHHRRKITIQLKATWLTLSVTHQNKVYYALSRVILHNLLPPLRLRKDNLMLPLLRYKPTDLILRLKISLREYLLNYSTATTKGIMNPLFQNSHMAKRVFRKSLIKARSLMKDKNLKLKMNVILIKFRIYEQGEC